MYEIFSTTSWEYSKWYSNLFNTSCTTPRWIHQIFSIFNTVESINVDFRFEITTEGEYSGIKSGDLAIQCYEYSANRPALWNFKTNIHVHGTQ